MNKKIVVGVFLALIIGIPLAVIFGVIPLTNIGLTSVPIADGTWQLHSRYDGMTVNGEHSTNTFFDCDGPVKFPADTISAQPTGGLAPGVTVSFSGFRAEGDPFRDGDYWVQTYDFDVDVSTTADKTGRFVPISLLVSAEVYESDMAAVSVDFAAVLQGIVDEKPDAMIRDLTIISGDAHITYYAGSWDAAEAAFEDEAKDSGYPHLAISPEVRFVDPSSSGSQIITGGTTEEAQGAINRVELRSGALFTAISAGNLIAHPRDVLAHFVIRTVVYSETPEELPDVNPLGWFLQFLIDLGILPPNVTEDILAILAVIGVFIFIIIITIIIACAWSRKK